MLNIFRRRQRFRPYWTDSGWECPDCGQQISMPIHITPTIVLAIDEVSDVEANLHMLNHEGTV